jgi:hypothetical protein
MELHLLVFKKKYGTLACFELLWMMVLICAVTDGVAYRSIHLAFCTYLQKSLFALIFFLFFIFVLVLRENSSFLCLFLFLLDIIDCYNLDQIYLMENDRSFMCRGLILMGH